VITSSKLTAANATLEEANRLQEETNTKLDAEIASVDVTLKETQVNHSKKVGELNHKIECVIEQNKSKAAHCHTRAPVVVRVEKNHGGCHGGC